MSTNLSVLSAKIAGDSRDHDEKQRKSRHRNALALIFQYLRDHGLYDTTEALLSESASTHCDIAGIRVCDNMDLASILLDFECGYFSRLQKKPKFIRELDPDEKPDVVLNRRRPGITKSESTKSLLVLNSGRKRLTENFSPKSIVSTGLPEVVGTGFTGKTNQGGDANVVDIGDSRSRLAKAINSYEGRSYSEFQDLAHIIGKEMYVDNPDVHWTDIKGVWYPTISLFSVRKSAGCYSFG